MPLYDYRCENCGDFREFLPMVESGTMRACPVCHAPSQRVFSAPFLAGRNLAIGNERPHNGQTRVPWRSLCGFGCSHCAGSH